MNAHDSLLDLLEARVGIVCAVGAGGKKSVLQHLATTHPGRVAITATAFTTYSQEHLGFAVVIDDEANLAARVAGVDPTVSVAYACPGNKPGRRAGVSATVIERIHRDNGFAATYVKADGARMRMIKAPRDDEPALPEGATNVIAVVSARAIGEPLTARIAHRVERIEHVAGMRENDRITPEHLGRLLASPDGMMKGTEGRRVVPVVNMVDDAALEVLARQAGEIALGLSNRFDRVVLTCLSRADQPVVGVVER